VGSAMLVTITAIPFYYRRIHLTSELLWLHRLGITSS